MDFVVCLFGAKGKNQFEKLNKSLDPSLTVFNAELLSFLNTSMINSDKFSFKERNIEIEQGLCACTKR